MTEQTPVVTMNNPIISPVNDINQIKVNVGPMSTENSNLRNVAIPGRSNNLIFNK